MNTLLDSLLLSSREGVDTEVRRQGQRELVARCRVFLGAVLALISLLSGEHESMVSAVVYLLAALALQWVTPWLKQPFLRYVPILVDALALFAYIMIRRDNHHPLENIMTFMTGGTLILLEASLLLSRNAILLAIALVGTGYVTLFYNFFWSAQTSYGAPLLMAIIAAAGLYIHNLNTRVAYDSQRYEKLCRFLSPQVLSEVDRSDQLGDFLKAQSCEITVMFADIRGFTTLSEKWPPEHTVETLNEYFALCTRVIYKHGGTVDKFIGDCVMALFGAPISNKDDAHRAVRAALEIQQEMERWNSVRLAEGKDPIRIGIGLNTSVVMAGAMGTAQRLEYTAIGDGVNVASRLCGMTKEFRMPLVFSGATAENISTEFQCLPLGESNIRGRIQSLKVYTLQGQKEWDQES